MLQKMIACWGKQTSTVIMTTGVLLVAIVGAVDWASGHEISVSIFYLAPIALVVWFAGIWQGTFVAVLSAVVWFLADILPSGYSMTHPAIPFWNAFVWLGFFFVVSLLLGKLKKAYDAQVKLVEELRDALENIQVLKGLIPICAWCKQIRDDKGYWQQVETYISTHSKASFTHAICPKCKEKLDRELQELAAKKSGQ